MEFEIYFRDLSEEMQKELLEAANIGSPELANWDFFPIATAVIKLLEEDKNDE